MGQNQSSSNDKDPIDPPPPPTIPHPPIPAVVAQHQSPTLFSPPQAKRQRQHIIAPTVVSSSLAPSSFVPMVVSSSFAAALAAVAKEANIKVALRITHMVMFYSCTKYWVTTEKSRFTMNNYRLILNILGV
jgi:hypothetical protein